MAPLDKFRYWVRLRSVAGFSHVWYAAGGGWKALARHARLGSEVMIGQLAAMPLPPQLRRADPLRIAFFTMMGSHSYMVATEIALARVLQARGHEVKMVLCDRVLPLCENKIADDPGRWDFACYKCVSHGLAQMRASKVPFETASHLAQSVPDSEAEVFIDGLEFGFTVESALLKHFRVGRLDSSEQTRRSSALMREACRISARAALGLSRWRPDRVVMSHGVYATWAPALAVFNRLGIPVAVYNKGKRKNSSVMNWVVGTPERDVSREWERVRDMPLTPDQESRLDEYLESRISHKDDARRYNFGGLESAEELRERLHLDPAKQTFVLFTNVLWDAASAQKEIAFPNAVDWVLETIHWFSAHPSKQLVVKIHPAEVVIGTKQPFAAEIRRAFPEIPENVRIIEPHEKINSWSVYHITDLGLVHTSTPGLELPLSGVPCAVVSKAHYRGRGFTIDVDTKEQYFKVMENWTGSGIDRGDLRELARRYAFLLFERYHLPWDFLFEPINGLFTALACETEAELAHHPTVELVCRAIENRGEFLRGSESEDAGSTFSG